MNIISRTRTYTNLLSFKGFERGYKIAYTKAIAIMSDNLGHILKVLVLDGFVKLEDLFHGFIVSII